MMIKKKISMAAWLLVWFCWGMGIGQVAAQYKTDFLLTGLQNEQLKTSVEQSLTLLPCKASCRSRQSLLCVPFGQTALSAVRRRKSLRNACKPHRAIRCGTSP